MRYAAILLALSLLLGCTSSAPTQASDLEEIQAQSRALSEAYARENIPALVAIYTVDGVAAPGGRDFVRGPEALRRLWTLPDGADVIRHQATPVEIVVDGDHAYDWGYYEGETVREGQASPFRGTYVIIWERGEDGVWRIAVDMWARLQNRN
ncbi:MAG: DUF4440 domain-containing protein [Acidobacteria bacterium]|nr:DUF4440 domain-containing protein [Acidobacteriota bacterium]